MASLPDIASPLTDGVVSLRLSAERDIPEILIAYQDDPELHRRLGLQRPPSGAQLGALQERAADARAHGTFVALSITEHASETCIGQVSAHDFDWTRGRAELAIWLAPAARGRGFGVAALGLASGWLLSAAGLRCLALQIRSDDEPMLVAARAAGFRVGSATSAAGPGSVPEPGAGPRPGRNGRVTLVRCAQGGPP